MLTIRETHFIEKYSLDIFNGSVDIFWSKESLSYVAINMLCNILNLNTYNEIQNIQEHEILKDGLVKDTSTLSCKDSLYLRTDRLAFWLTTIPLSKLTIDNRKDVELFQQGAALILQEAFIEGKLMEMGICAEEVNQTSVFAQAYKEALKLVSIARQHLIEETTLSTTEQ